MGLSNPSAYATRTHEIMAAQERRLTIRLRVMRALRANNDGRLFDLHARHAEFSERNSFYTMVMLRRLRRDTYGI
jgi:hypothetical protein